MSSYVLKKIADRIEFSGFVSRGRISLLVPCALMTKYPVEHLRHCAAQGLSTLPMIEYESSSIIVRDP